MTEISVLKEALSYLSYLIHRRIDAHFSSQLLSMDELLDTRRVWLVKGSVLFYFVEKYALDRAAQIVLLIAIAPHLQPDFFDRSITARLPKTGEHPQIGGWQGESHQGFLPTGDTVAFILAGSQLDDRLRVQKLLGPAHPLAKKQLLYLQPAPPGEPSMSGHLLLSTDTVNLLMGHTKAPAFSLDFPAQRITTDMNWDDLVLSSQTLQQIQELKTWILHSPTLLYEWGMKRTLRLGYRALFYGPPGTGKTLTASLLGKYTQKEVYKIDISMVVSKFIGETEKNLASLFAKAESKGWILFFDEADALFGKRTSVRDAHDRYANQEVSYLLQRIENYDGLVILASNLKNNIDDAFIRRFQSIVHFSMPGPVERSRLWQAAFPQQITLEDEIDLATVAQNHELSGADILNVVQYCCLRSLERGDRTILQQDLIQAIKREFAKVGKLLA